MKLNTRARYALRMMIELTRRTRDGETISLADISGTTDISRRYLEQLAMELRRAGLIRGVVGKGGGYALARPPEEITVGHIVTAAIGPINVVECVERPEQCLKAEVCDCRPIYRLLNSRVHGVLDSITLADATSGNLPFE